MAGSWENRHCYENHVASTLVSPPTRTQSPYLGGGNQPMAFPRTKSARGNLYPVRARLHPHGATGVSH